MPSTIGRCKVSGNSTRLISRTPRMELDHPLRDTKPSCWFRDTLTTPPHHHAPQNWIQIAQDSTHLCRPASTHPDASRTRQRTISRYPHGKACFSTSTHTRQDPDLGRKRHQPPLYRVFISWTRCTQPRLVLRATLALAQGNKLRQSGREINHLPPSSDKDDKILTGTP